MIDATEELRNAYEHLNRIEKAIEGVQQALARARASIEDGPAVRGRCTQCNDLIWKDQMVDDDGEKALCQDCGCWS